MFPYGTKSRENNGPNGQPAQCMTPSEFYKIRYIQSIALESDEFDFVVVSEVVRRFATGDAFVYL